MMLIKLREVGDPGVKDVVEFASSGMVKPSSDHGMMLKVSLCIVLE